MISKDQLAFAARYADAQCEELGLPGWCAHHGVILGDLVWLGEQRAMRGILAGRGPEGERDIARIARGEHVPVRMTAAEQVKMPLVMGTWIDGFAAGLTVQRRDEE